MKVNEMIEFLEKGLECAGNYDEYGNKKFSPKEEIEINGEVINEIIELLKRHEKSMRIDDSLIHTLKEGKRHKQMWEEFQSLYGFNRIDINENKNSFFGSRLIEYKTIHTLCEIIKQKYLKE